MFDGTELSTKKVRCVLPGYLDVVRRQLIRCPVAARLGRACHISTVGYHRGVCDKEEVLATDGFLCSGSSPRRLETCLEHSHRDTKGILSTDVETRSSVVHNWIEQNILRSNGRNGWRAWPGRM